MSIHLLYRRSRNCVVKVFGDYITYDVSFQYGGRHCIECDWLILIPKLKSNAGDEKICKKKNLSCDTNQ